MSDSFFLWQRIVNSFLESFQNFLIKSFHILQFIHLFVCFSWGEIEISIIGFASFGIWFWFWFWFSHFSECLHHRKSFRVITPRTSFFLSTTTKCRRPNARKISNIFDTDAFSMALCTERFMNVFKSIEYAKSFLGIGTFWVVREQNHKC